MSWQQWEFLHDISWLTDYSTQNMKGNISKTGNGVSIKEVLLEYEWKTSLKDRWFFFFFFFFFGCLICDHFFSLHSSLFSTFDPYMIIVYVTNARAHTHAQIADRKKTLLVEIPIWSGQEVLRLSGMSVNRGIPSDFRLKFQKNSSV